MARTSLFKGKMTSTQTDGLAGILAEWEAAHAQQNLCWLAYALATTHHETAQTFRPIEEYGKGKGRPYGKPVPSPNGPVYFGRGFVQLTWIDNYRKLGARIGVDLVAHPELALDPANATKILFAGMIEGLFSGKRLSDYFHDETADWSGARHIINGTDKADLIAGYGKAFLACLQAR